MDIGADLAVFLRLLLIIFLSGILGWERESAGKSAGLRTHVLVGASALLFVVIATAMVDKFIVYGDAIRFDPVRIVEAVVTGISFLGAGMIFFSRGQGDVKGLTTAAGILTTAAIGMLVGLERYVLAVGTTAIVFVVLHFVRIYEEKVLRSRNADEKEA